MKDLFSRRRVCKQSQYFAYSDVVVHHKIHIINRNNLFINVYSKIQLRLAVSLAHLCIIQCQLLKLKFPSGSVLRPIMHLSILYMYSERQPVNAGWRGATAAQRRATC